MSMKDFIGNNAVPGTGGNIADAHALHTDPAHFGRIGWWVTAVGVGGFLLWASLAPLDQGVPVSGSVVSATNRKAVQHQTGGTIREILAREGDVVKAGQVLVRLQDEQARSQTEASRAQLFHARAAEARLIAERDGLQKIRFPAELESLRSDTSDPRAASHIALQEQLFASRQLALRNELGALDESIAGLKMQIDGLMEARENKKQQIAFLGEQLAGMRDLAREGYIPRNRLLELERTYAQLSASVSEDLGNIGRAQRQVTELGMRRVQRQQEYQKEVRQQLADVQKEVEVLGHRFASQSFELENLQVRAPVDGTVVGMNVFTQGGVVAPGFRMMDIVPGSDPLIVEGQVPVALIDKVKDGLPVELIFSAFARNTTPRIPGVVTHVSADRFQDEATGMPYYRIKAKVAPEALKMVTDLGLQAGMPVELFIRTGERTLMNYLFKPILDRAHTALTED